MYNRELEKIDNQEKAYVYGIFYADGNVQVKRSNVRMELYKDDIDTLNSIRIKFPFFKLYEYKNKNHFVINCSSVKLKEDFIKNGCLPQKSVINKDLIRIPQMDESLISHFIRGYFDGNGGCHYNNVSKGKPQKRVYIYSASIQLLKDIQEVLLLKQINTVMRTNRSIFMLQISTNSYIKFYNYLYDNAIMFMNRKEVILRTLKETNIFIQRIAPNCKFCNSSHTVYDGYNRYKEIKYPRILCRECKRHTTIKSAPIRSNSNSALGELLES